MLRLPWAETDWTGASLAIMTGDHCLPVYLGNVSLSNFLNCPRAFSIIIFQILLGSSNSSALYMSFWPCCLHYLSIAIDRIQI